jgi:hypothetical protein
MPHTIRAHRHKRLSSARVRRAKTRQAAVFSSSHCRASRAQQPATADLTRTDWTKLVGSSVLGSKHSRPIVVGGMSSALNSAHGRHRPAVASAVEGRSRVGQSSKHIHRCATLACTASSTGPCENHQEWERPAVNWAKFANNLSGMACRSVSSINRICISSTRQAHPMHAMPTTQEHRRRRSGKLGDKGSRPSGMR